MYICCVCFLLCTMQSTIDLLFHQQTAKKPFFSYPNTLPGAPTLSSRTSSEKNKWFCATCIYADLQYFVAQCNLQLTSYLTCFYVFFYKKIEKNQPKPKTHPKTHQKPKTHPKTQPKPKTPQKSRKVVISGQKEPDHAWFSIKPTENHRQMAKSGRKKAWYLPFKKHPPRTLQTPRQTPPDP